MRIACSQLFDSSLYTSFLCETWLLFKRGPSCCNSSPFSIFDSSLEELSSFSNFIRIFIRNWLVTFDQKLPKKLKTNVLLSLDSIKNPPPLEGRKRLSHLKNGLHPPSTCPPTPNFRQSSTHQPEPGCYRFFARSRIVRAPTNVSRHMAESCTFCPSFVRAPSVHGCRLLPPLPSPRPNPR